MKRVCLVIALLLATQLIFAQKSIKVDASEAMQYGLNYIKSVNPTKADVQVKSYELLKSENTGKACYHVFNYENGGFVLVSADRRGVPVLGYSEEGEFDFVNGAPAAIAWVKQYMQQLDEIEAADQELTKEQINAWKPQNHKAGTRSVEPLLTTFWNQDYPYNMYCPEHSQGNHGHTYTGCVATAMAQVMNYWEWPKQGKGYVAYYWGQWDTIRFSETTYDWDNMADRYSIASSQVAKEAVATLMLHAGVSLNMNYGYDGSGTQTELCVNALKNYFGYRNGMVYKTRDNGVPATDEGFEHYYDNDTIWTRMLIEELDLSRPLIYSGRPKTGAGHAWVCDGYRITDGVPTFHMNWGWGGSSNGWFTVDRLTTHASASDNDDSNFNLDQGAVFNLAVPDYNVAPYCMQEQTNVYETEYWTINDGSYANYYKPGTNCDWLIKIDNYENDTLSYHFNYFDLAAGDVLNVYKGEDASGELIGSYSEGNEPIGEFKHIGTPIYMEFITDNQDQARGWEMFYEAMRFPFYINASVNGNGGRIVPEGQVPAMKNSTLIFSMLPDEGKTVKSFVIDDLVTLKGTGQDDEIGFTFTNIKSNHSIEVTFTNSSKDGGLAGIDTEANEGIAIYPNPNNGKFSINFGGSNAEEYAIIDITGRIIESKAIDSQEVNIDLNLEAGTYFVKTVSEGKTIIQKVVVE